jgi:hypothetical protein
VVPGRRIIGTYGSGAVKNEKTNWMGVGSFGEGVCFVVSPERGFLGDLVRFLIAYLLNTVFSVPVKRGRLYRTESDCKEMGYGFQIVSEKFYTVDDFNPHRTKGNKMIIVWHLAGSSHGKSRRYMWR